MRGVLGKPGWFWLFLIDGLITFVIGLISFFYLPSSPTQTKSVLCPRPWYTERQEVIMINASTPIPSPLHPLTIHPSACSATTPPKA
jgi:hypothetical protein